MCTDQQSISQIICCVRGFNPRLKHFPSKYGCNTFWTKLLMVSWVDQWLALWVRCHPFESAITAAAFFGKTCPVFPWNTTWRGSKTPSAAALPSTVNWRLSSFPKLSTCFAPLTSYVRSEKGFRCTFVWSKLTTRQSGTECIEQSAATRNAISSPWTTQSSGSFLAAPVVRRQVQPRCLWAKALANVLETLNLIGWPSLSLPTTLSNSSRAPTAITPWIVVLMIELSICWPTRRMPLRQLTIWLAVSGWSLKMPLGFSMLRLSLLPLGRSSSAYHFWEANAPSPDPLHTNPSWCWLLARQMGFQFCQASWCVASGWERLWGIVDATQQPGQWEATDWGCPTSNSYLHIYSS